MSTKLTDISKYYLEEVLKNGKKFPHGTWNGDEKYENAKNVTRTLFEKVLKWNDEDIRNKVSSNVFCQNCLSGMFKNLFKGSVYATLNNAYPGKFYFWELSSSKVPNLGYNSEILAQATRWLIEKKLGWSEKDVCEKLRKKTFIENSLSYVLSVFHSCPYLVLENAYPGKYKPWQLHYTTKMYWNLETAKEATKWLIEEKLMWDNEDVKKYLSPEIFYENGLRYMLITLFKSNPYLAIENAYPGKYNAWEISKKVPRNYWNKKTTAQATKWLIETKLKWSFDQVREKISSKVFEENGLMGMLKTFFSGEVYAALDNAYPNEFVPWELAKASKSFWNMETAKEAIRWLIETKLKWSFDEAKEKISYKVFYENRLEYILQEFFHSNPYYALKNAYPDKF